MRASFLCVTTRDLGSGCIVLARRGGPPPADWDLLAHPRAPGFYVAEPVGPALIGHRPAVASDFEAFGFPCPGSFAVGALRRIEAEARQGIKATIPINPARPHLLAIRAEANRGLAMEGVGVGVATEEMGVGAETGKAINEMVEVTDDDGAID